MSDDKYLLSSPLTLPTHVARVVARVNQAGLTSASETFLLASYVVESVVKTVAVALCAALRRSSSTALYRFEYELVRADGLGTWESMISACTTQSYAGYVHKDIQPLLTWLSKKRTKPGDQWAREAAAASRSILDELGTMVGPLPVKLNVRYIISQLVQIRNKTKAHGAVGEEFYQKITPHYLAAIRALLQQCPLFQWEWLFLAERSPKRNVKAVALQGPSPAHLPADEANALRPPDRGIYFRTAEAGQLHPCCGLLHTDWECHSFLLPNGGMSDKGYAEFLDYGTGRTESRSMSRLLAPPATAPPSATAGQSALDVYSNVFGNLPPLTKGYVERPKLQGELLARLQDTNHPIITLHGRGGIGKTSLALNIAYTLAEEDSPRFDHILWFSARDLELRPTGASEVRREVPSLDVVCRLLSDFLDTEPTPNAFAEVLHAPAAAGSRGMLFIFDNFETFDEPRAVHKFLDTHAHVPNKILITSRERAFKGDYPIEVGGMEAEEAMELLRRESVELNVQHIITDDRMRQIIEYTNGHAYVMRVLVGEVARDHRWVPLKSLVPRRADLLSAIFERSFNRLTPDGRWVFLAVANWRSVVSELALLIVLGLRDVDVEAGLDECVDLSLLTRAELQDGQGCYYAPELARLFARKKLEGDPDRLAINEDIQNLQEFGPAKASELADKGIGDMVSHYVSQARRWAEAASEEERREIDLRLAQVAELWPDAWMDVVAFRDQFGLGDDEVAYALRRAVEERPYVKEVWLARARHAAKMSDSATKVASLVSAVEASPTDVDLVREAALELCKYIDAHKYEIPQARRGTYLASVRSHMEQLAPELDATGLSRLAWLFLLEGDTTKGWEYANLGLAKDATNSHCLKIVERLDMQGEAGQS